MPQAKRKILPFWGRVRKTDECWFWRGYCDRQGYGVTSRNGKTISAHRLAWTMTNGEIPVGMKVLHRCDNPPCVNPDHLFLGTQAQNVADMKAKGRHATATGNRHPTLTPAQIRAIRRVMSRKLLPASEVAALAGVSLYMVNRIDSGEPWSDDSVVMVDDWRPRRGAYRRGELSTTARLTREAVMDIRQHRADGTASTAELATKHGVSSSLVSRVVARKAWAHIN